MMVRMKPIPRKEAISEHFTAGLVAAVTRLSYIQDRT